MVEFLLLRNYRCLPAVYSLSAELSVLVLNN